MKTQTFVPILMNEHTTTYPHSHKERIQSSSSTRTLLSSTFKSIFQDFFRPFDVVVWQQYIEYYFTVKIFNNIHFEAKNRHGIVLKLVENCMCGDKMETRISSTERIASVWRQVCQSQHICLFYLRCCFIVYQ